MNKTNIEWVKNPYWEWADDTGEIHISGGDQGYTLNSKTGCLNGCPYCYARKLANGRLRQRYLANKNIIDADPYHPRRQEDELSDPFYPRFWPDRIWQVYRHKKPVGIFLDDMADWMGDYWPEEWTRLELEMIRANPQHRFYTLTKQPQNLRKWSPFPDNCWVGVTATDETMFYEACYKLKHVKAKVKYLSIEPLLRFNHLPEVLDFGRWIYLWLLEGGINWVIIGAQTKPYKPPHIEWVQEIVEACDKAGIAVFLKDNLRPLLFNYDVLDEYPHLFTHVTGRTDLRQELPQP